MVSYRNSKITRCYYDAYVKVLFSLLVDLLGLLNWVSDPVNVGSNLQALMKVEGEEVVKFLQDVLDTLFNVLMLNPDSNVHDDMVFNCLV